MKIGSETKRDSRRGLGLGLGLLAGLLVAAAPASALPRYSEGHADAEIVYDALADEWEFELLCEECTIDGTPIVGDQVFESDQVVIVVPETTVTTALGEVGGVIDDTPTGAAAGEDYYKLPEAELEADAENAPFLGLARDEVDLGVFVNDEITLSLLSISYTGLGSDPEFSMFSSDAGLGVPNPDFWMSTFEPGETVNTDNSIVLSVGPGTHSHFNLGFTELGVYEITYQASGNLVGGGTTSGTGTYLYSVPEPATGLLLAASMGGLALIGRRRERVSG